MRKLIAGAALLAAAVIAVPIALGAGGSSVSVQLKEFKVLPKPTSAKVGKVTFTVKNIGALTHELVVLKTNVPAGKLPVNSKSQVSEKGAVGKLRAILPGTTKKLTLTLKPGKYVLLCNLRGHYKAGQYAAFTVK